MTKAWRVLANIVIISFIVLSVGGALIAADKAAKEPIEAPEVVTIENKGYKKDKKGPVKFQHKKHQDEYKNVEDKKIECTECHHKYDENKKNTWKEGDPVQKCGAEDCHDPLKKKDKIKKLQIAYHKNCKDCHKALVKAGKKKDKEAPYKKCKTCMGGKPK